ncbi:MAG: T9SS type A sorting domain-containing protein [Flavobacteriales bacterium]|nr:T9SS type A sorting domain-containing protein [Flavobacteriales bacterium]
MVVCDAANDQRYLTAIIDADSGYFAFWSDTRNDADKAQLFGQHFDSEGNSLWTPGGELLLSQPGRSINELAPVLMPDGSVIVVYTNAPAAVAFGDTVNAMRFDANGTALWTTSAVLNTGNPYLTPKVILSDSCAYAMVNCYNCNAGFGAYRIQRVRMDGDVVFPLPGPEVGSGWYGPHMIQPDAAGGALVTMRCGNGAGTCLKAQRYDSLGIAAWTGYIDLADASGLGYAFTTTVDENASQVAVWEVVGDLRMNRIDTTGAPLWSPAVQVATDLAVHVQQNPAAVAIGNELFVAWSDNRPPANFLDLYVQKYDLATGAELWAPDGVPAIRINTYIPYTGLVASDSGGVVATFDGNVDGYSAMRVRNDGTPAWPEPVVFCTPAFNPNGSRRTHLPDGHGGVVAFWENATGSFYGARIYRNGRLYDDVSIPEKAHGGNVGAYPNPAQDRITFQLPAGERALGVDLFAAQGAVSTVDPDGQTIHIDQLMSGAYVARVRTQNNVFTARFIKN